MYSRRRVEKCEVMNRQTEWRQGGTSIRSYPAPCGMQCAEDGGAQSQGGGHVLELPPAVQRQPRPLHPAARHPRARRLCAETRRPQIRGTVLPSLPYPPSFFPYCSSLTCLLQPKMHPRPPHHDPRHSPHSRIHPLSCSLPIAPLCLASCSLK